MHAVIHEAGSEIVREGDEPFRTCFVVSGFVCGSKLTPMGQRQIVAIYVQNDMPDLQSVHLARMDMTLSTLARSELAFIPHEVLRRLCTEYPRVAIAFWRVAMAEVPLYRQWMTNLGKGSAVARTAHFMCELVARLQSAGRSNGLNCDFPFTHAEIADLTGLSVVHVGRVLTELRRSGLIALSGRRLDILNRDGLARAAGFDPGYLALQRQLARA